MSSYSILGLVSIIEHIQLQGYTQKHAGHWVDEHNNTVARDTFQLVDLYEKQMADELRTMQKEHADRKPYVDKRYGLTEHRRKYANTKPNLPEQYRYQKTRIAVKCFCCRKEIPALELRFWKPNYDICETCMNQWRSTGGDLKNLKPAI